MAAPRQGAEAVLQEHPAAENRGGAFRPAYGGDRLMATAYVNGQVIDGRGNAYQGYVIVDGDKIAEVGQRQSGFLGRRPSSAGI